MNNNVFKTIIYLPPTIFTFVIISLDGLSLEIISVFFGAVIVWSIILWGFTSFLDEIYFKSIHLAKKNGVLDSDFGELKVGLLKNSSRWIINKKFLGVNMDIYIKGNKRGIYKKEKKKLLNIFNNEEIIKIKAEKALNYELEKNIVEFTSLSKHLNMDNVKLIIIYDLLGEDFHVSYPVRKDEFHSYNVIFRNYNVYAVEYD